MFLCLKNLSNLGHLSLNISTWVYLIWFIPQLYLNFKRHDTRGLSLHMHGILSLGYLCDWCYGGGLAMPWQYRFVTLVGLISLAIQHYQWGCYGLHTRWDRRAYLFWSFVFLIFIFIYVCLTLGFIKISHVNYDRIGMVSNICWFTYMLPQIIKNYVNHSTKGLSFYFVLIALFLNLCDATSAWTLGWDYPSKIGAGIAFFKNGILLAQIFYLKNKI